jgi:uncharacterized membrane protein YgcG
MMAKQPEQILEEQLVEQLQRLNYGLGYIKAEKELIQQMHSQSTVKKIKEMFTESKNSITFAPTVPVLLPVRSACGSFFLNKIQNNTPSMPLFEAHLEGFFVYSKFIYYA